MLDAYFCASIIIGFWTFLIVCAYGVLTVVDKVRDSFKNKNGKNRY